MSIAEFPTVSVLVIVKDEPEIARTLEILEIQCEEVDAECIVVDASDHRLDLIRAKHSWAEWVDYQQPVGRRITIPQQRNIAVAKAKGAILVFCDAGGEPCQVWLKDLITPILEGKAKITGGPVTIISKAAPDFGYNNQEYGSEVKVPTTANMAFTREVFELARGFDEALPAGEDAAFVWTLNRNGIKQFAIPQAIMALNNGTSRREMIRAWRYGKAMSNLFHKFPERRNIKKKSNPELVIYPILLLMFVSSLALLALNASKSIFVLILLIITYGLLALKNRKSRRPWFGLLYKTIHALSMCLETLRRKIFHRTKDKVMSYPLNDSRYSSELKKALARSEFELHEFYQLTGSETVNTFLLPLTPLIMRVQGYRILHIHWLFQFKLHWQVSKRWKYIMRCWFMLWISITKIFGIKIIWTVHDPLPHEQIFDNDLAASVMLMNNCTALIALNEHSLQQLRIKHNSTKSILIPEGPLFMPTTINQMETRSLLHVAPTKRLIVLAGYLQPYKGVTALLEGARFLPSSLAIRIAGRADEQYQKDLGSILIKLKSQNIDIDITFGHLTDDEYGGYLNSADFICVPFIDINNSGSINSALCSGVPVIIPSIPSLNWIPSGARIDISCDSEGHFDFKQLFQSLERISVSEYDSMKKSALLWASTVTWADVARQHIDLYQGITGNHN